MLYALCFPDTHSDATHTRQVEDEEPPAKMKKLAIVEEREEDKYEHRTAVKCWKCDPETGRELPDASADPHVQSLVTGVMQSLSSARQSEVKAWEEEIAACEHTLMLEQLVTGPIAASGKYYSRVSAVSADMTICAYTGLAHCTKCDLKENLWLCLTCGSLGCGRQQFGGLGGNGHGLLHYEETKHPVSVKLGTITPEGTAGALHASTGWRIFILLFVQTFTAMSAMTRNSILTLRDTLPTLVSMCKHRRRQRSL